MTYLCGWSSKSRGIEKTEGKGTRQSSFECISMSSLLGYLKPRFLTFYFGLRFSFWFLHRQFALEKYEIHGWKFTNLLFHNLVDVSESYHQLLGKLNNCQPSWRYCKWQTKLRVPWGKNNLNDSSKICNLPPLFLYFEWYLYFYWLLSRVGCLIISWGSLRWLTVLADD